MIDQPTTKQLFAQLIQTSREIEQAVDHIHETIVKQMRVVKGTFQRQTWLRFLKNVYFVVDIIPWPANYGNRLRQYRVSRPFL
jgi:hypothetical protein